MKKIKTILCTLLCLAFALSLPLAALCESVPFEIPELYLKATTPDGFAAILSDGARINEEIFNNDFELSEEEVADIAQQMMDEGTFYFAAQYEPYIEMNITRDDNVDYVLLGNFKELSDREMIEMFLQSNAENPAEGIEFSNFTVKSTDQVKYLVMDFTADDQEYGMDFSGRQYFTVVNNMAVVITLCDFDGAGDYSALEELVGSIEFTQIKETMIDTVSESISNAIFLGIIISGVIIAGVTVLIVVLINKNKKKNANQLAAIQQYQQNSYAQQPYMQTPTDYQAQPIPQGAPAQAEQTQTADMTNSGASEE